MKKSKKQDLKLKTEKLRVLLTPEELQIVNGGLSVGCGTDPRTFACGSGGCI